MFESLILKDMFFANITIKNVPVKINSDNIPGMTRGTSEKIKDLVFKAHALKVDEIDFSYNLHSNRKEG